MIKKSLALILMAVLSSFHVHAQGCSDAGFCTMGAMKPDQPFNKRIVLRLRSIEFGLYRGKTSLTPIVYVGTMDFNFSLNTRNTFQIKVPYQNVSGLLGDTHGFGDLSLSYTRNLFSSEKYDINFSVGGKIPTNDSNLKWYGKPMPMYYQTSLGTFDLVAGASLLSRDWLIATGIQHPFDRNKNQFTWGAWTDYPYKSYLHKYPASKNLKRGTDIMLRVERNFRFSRLNLAIGILPIYRLNRDVRTNATTGVDEKIDGSQGLVMTTLLSAGYSLNVRSGFKMLYGIKTIGRELATNPDGLSRENVVTLSYYYRF